MQKVRDLLDLCKSLKMTSCLKVCIYFLIVKKKQLRPDFYKDVMKNNEFLWKVLKAVELCDHS